MHNETDAERNGMTEAEWSALSDDARAWRSKHPTLAVTPRAAPVERVSAAADPAPPPPAAAPGGTVVLSGAAQAAARGELHGDLVKNTEARDAALYQDDPRAVDSSD